MSLPVSRTTFKEFILQELGAPVLEINVADEQVDNQIDLALAYYADFHFDGTQKQFYKIPITANLHSDAIHHLTLASGGTGYANTDTVVFTARGKGQDAAATINTFSNGTIQSVSLSNNGVGYFEAPTITVSSNTGSGASITSELGGWIELPENIIGISKVFPFSYLTSANDMFSVEYQFALNNLYTITNAQLVPWYMSLMHIQLFQEILVGRTPFRFNRNTNRLYIDNTKGRLIDGQFLVIETFMTLDPDVYTDVWKDRYLIRYTTALVKRQWGNNLKKFSGMMLPGGVGFSGQQIYDEAVEEIKALEEEMLNSWSLPALDIMA